MEAATIRVKICDCPGSFDGREGIRVAFQSQIRPPRHEFSANNEWEIRVNVKDGKWTGYNVGRNGDGRRFIYFAWADRNGTMFRRIKLYQDQVQGDSVRLSGRMKDGSPACSTAIVLPSD
ncbi:MAG TPA: DUF5990 family protein [Fimbriimonas sp.]|nr:DUF5990 family protein [Fimbriimonas sp.]